MNRGKRHSLGESVRMALDTLRAHKLRSLLTILGILIGITTVMAMTSLIRGLNEEVSRTIEQAGPNVLFLRKSEAKVFVGGTPEEIRNRKDFRVEDAAAIRSLPAVLDAAPIYFMQDRLSYRGERTQNLFVLGTSPSLLRVRNIFLQDGRFLTREDIQHRRKVCVLALGAVEVLFPHLDPLGKEIRIGGEEYRVVGTLEKQENLFSDEPAQYVVLPYPAFENQYGRGGDNLFIDFVPRGPGGSEEAIEQVTQLMRVRRKVPPGKPNDFAILTQASVLDFWNELTGVFFLVMVAISSIGLIVGGIGVMNIMLVSVTERTREIGIRKAIGARRRDILWQFLVEAATLTAVGGLAGTLLGGGIAKGIAWFTNFPASTPLWSVLIALAFSASIGLFFGIYPANRAARMDPIEALRYE